MSKIEPSSFLGNDVKHISAKVHTLEDRVAKLEAIVDQLIEEINGLKSDN